MEPKLQPRKRKLTSAASDSFTGNYTLSKSKIYLHHNRSARSDTIRRRNHIQLTDSRNPKQESLNKIDDDEASRIFIKDLRVKRVFSPASSNLEDLEVDCKSQNLSNVSPDSEVLKSIDTNLNLVDFSVCKDDLKSNDMGVSFTENLNGSNPSLMDEIEGIGRQNGGISNQSSISSIKLVSNLQKRKKLYKAPSSFSYRRLLPYLTAVENDDSCYSKIEIVDMGSACKSQSKSPNMESKGDCGFGDKYENIGALDDRKPMENGGITKADSCEDQKLNRESPSMSQTEGSLELNNGGPVSHEGGRDNAVDYLMEECNQATPPDADIFGGSQLGATAASNVLQNETKIRKDGCVAESLSEQQNESISKCQQVLKPCSRIKLFKTPSSVSYRRLLPFLMDIAKDNSSASKTNECPKLEKDLEQKPSTLILVSSPEDVLLQNSETKSNSGKHCLGDKEPNLLKPIVNSLCGSSAETYPGSPSSMLTSCNGYNSRDTLMLSSESSIEPHMPLDSNVEVPSKLEQVILERPTEMKQEFPCKILGNGHQTNHLAVSLCCTVNHENFHSDCTELKQVESTKACSVPLVGFGNAKLKPITVSSVQNSFQTEACDSSGGHIVLRKGILKRNPRGCRGLCNCLNCATFRLHAERAFEFSRNQMHDAEEVTLELIKELADIRNMLEQSSVDANNQVVLRGEQVKEACRKALQTEEIAKMSLSQMREDLSFHCRNKRLERPRVAFANNVEEKTIPNGSSLRT